ncbi:MAG: uncharacterized protein A8A55_2194 [Amphiamblys sp. WSBS2006]|nr:MAG: uncharacterized protein A8A55_2194 [Amphiamblys sp. WSBS2006]
MLNSRGKLLRLCHRTRHLFPRRKTIFTLARKIAEDWEAEPDKNTNKLASYIKSVLLQLQEVSDNVLFPALCSLVYVKRLRKRYASFKGEEGCSYRLFSAGLIVAARTWTSAQAEMGRKKKRWSEIVKLFSDDDLAKMGKELVYFLGNNLSIDYCEFVAFFEKNFLENTDAVVPGDEERIFAAGTSNSDFSLLFDNCFDL